VVDDGDEQLHGGEHRRIESLFLEHPETSDIRRQWSGVRTLHRATPLTFLTSDT
jgi:hypothetical protein